MLPKVDACLGFWGRSLRMLTKHAKLTGYRGGTENEGFHLGTWRQLPFLSSVTSASG